MSTIFSSSFSSFSLATASGLARPTRSDSLAEDPISKTTQEDERETNGNSTQRGSRVNACYVLDSGAFGCWHRQSMYDSA